MQIHHYNPTTGLPLGASQADESPLEPGVYLIPAHATPVAPPVSGSGDRVRWDGSDWRIEPIPVPEQPAPPTLDDLRMTKRSEVDAAYRYAISPVIDGYTEEERDSWSMQEAEARALQTDPAAPTPLLSAIATARGISVADLANIVITKAAQYATLAGTAFGTRRVLLAAITAATDSTHLDAIAWA